MGTVYLALARNPAGLHKLVVLKELQSAVTADPEFVSMFLDEARLSAKLEHPNIVQTTDVGIDDERFFIAMEYLEGVSLRRIVDRFVTLPLAMHLHCVKHVLEGLHFAHELRGADGRSLEIVHRDVSPSNVLVTYDGLVKIVDFGTAKAKDSAHATRAGLLRGRATYMAPEQPSRRYDRRADIFSVGVMLWEALAGRRMWGTKTDIEILRHLALDEVTPITTAKPDVDPTLGKICNRALASTEEERYPTAAAMAEDIAVYIEATSSKVTARELGAFISRGFEHERAHVRGVIEEQMRKPPADVAPEDLPSIDYGPAFEPRMISQAPPRGGAEDEAPPSLAKEAAPAARKLPLGAIAVALVVLAAVVALLRVAR
jgi:serine/threonine-protein kinase